MNIKTLKRKIVLLQIELTWNRQLLLAKQQLALLLRSKRKAK